jgi:MazG family protein
MEELGDLLLQIVLQTQVAVDEGEFQMPDVIAAIDEKLKRRHPHVWKGLDVNGVQDVVSNWEAIKHQERQNNGKAEQSLLDGIPKMLPALTQAYTIRDRVGRIGLHLRDKSRLPNSIIKILQDIQKANSPDVRTKLLGQMLFIVVLWAHSMNLDPESALREANIRFSENFKILESREQKDTLEEMTDDEISKLWE